MRTIKFRAWDKVNKSWQNNWFSICHQGFAIYDADGFENEVAERFELSQFTGLYDKNGKEIYEGDFLISPFTGDPAPVIYDQEYCQFTFGGSEFNVEVKHKKLEVIGNIYENPEYGK